jgi:hypothetical protein
MFSLGNGKQTIIVDGGTTLQVGEPSQLLQLLRVQQQLLERAMSEKDMALYEMQAEQISELLLQLSTG